MTKHRFFCASSTLAVIFSLHAVQAQAQTAAAAAPPAAASAPTTVSDLVVTAERREERLESVPAAISAYGAEQRAIVGITSVQDLSDYTPGLSISTLTNRPYLRGVGRNTDNLATESAVAVYYNNVYDGANASTLLQHSDLFIDTIEIDRGPQNLLHGSNADGGAINYVSKRPTNSFYAEGRAGVENYGKWYGEAVVSGPINDNVRFRLGGNYTDQTGGFFDNLNGKNQGGTVVQGNSGKSHYVEAQIDANLGEHLDAWAMASSGGFKANYHTVATQGAIPDNLFLNGTFSPSSFYGLCALPGVAGSPGGNAGCAGGPTIVGTPVTQSITANQFPGNNPTTADPHQFIQNYTSTNNLTNNISLATNVTYHFPSANLTYYGGYQKFDYNLDFTTAAESGVLSYQLAGATAPGLCAFDAAGAGYSAAGCAQPLTINAAPNLTHFVEHEKFFSHEIDLASSNDSPVQWIGGLYWYHEHYEQPVWAGVVPNQTQFANPYYVSLTTGALTPAPANPASAASTSDTFLTYNSYAAFGQVDWQINDQFKLTGGARYTKDKKRGLQQWRFEEFDLVPGFTSASFGANTPALDLTSIAVGDSATTAYEGAGIATLNAATGNYERALNDSWGAWTGAVNLNWTPDPTMLGYAKYSRGYKTGGFSTNTIAANPETKPEYVDAYEVGFKKTSQTFQINGAVFYYNYKNDQYPLDVQNAQGLIAAQIFNLKSVHTSGAELEGIWRPIDPLTLNLQYSHLHAKIHDAGACFEDTVDPLAQLPGANTTGCAAGTATARLQNINGEYLPESPPNKVSANAIYTFTFDPGKLSLSGSFIWKDKTYGSVFNREYATSKAYSQTNLRATWADSKDRYNVIAFVNNVFDQRGFDNTNGTLMVAGSGTSAEQIVTNRYLTAPRTYGVEFEYRFR